MIPNDPNASNKRLARMSAALDEKMNDKLGHRADLYIGNFKPIDKDSARLQINYDMSIGEALSPDVESFVLRTFDGKLIPQMNTAKQHGDAGCVTLVISKHMPKRPIEDSSNMTVIVAEAIYLDQNMGDTWEVQTLDDGTKYLSRADDDDITAIVEERRRRMSAGLSTSYVNKLSSSIPTCNIGDVIEFYRDGQTHRGMIVSTPGDRVKVRTEAGTTDIATEAILRLVEHSLRTDAATDEELVKYFTDAFGYEDYAKELVKPN